MVGTAAPIAAPALAQTFELDNQNRVIVSDLVPYESYTSTYTGFAKTRAVTTNACGFYRLRSTSSYPLADTDTFSIAGVNYTRAALSTVTTPGCTDGTTTDNPGSGVFKNGDGDVFVMGAAAPYQSFDVTYGGIPLSRNSKANACGIISLSDSGSFAGYSGPVAVTVKDTGAAVGSVTVSSLTAGPSDPAFGLPENPKLGYFLRFHQNRLAAHAGPVKGIFQSADR